jgi:hypothetical protein
VVKVVIQQSLRPRVQTPVSPKRRRRMNGFLKDREHGTSSRVLA